MSSLGSKSGNTVRFANSGLESPQSPAKVTQNSKSAIRLPNGKMDLNKLQQITLSKIPYNAPKILEKEDYDRESEPDRMDEMAIRADFKNNQPDLETVVRRAQYRAHLDYRCLPTGQDFCVISTYGPSHREYDIETTDGAVGFYFWGVFSTEEAAAEHIVWIRETNPHTVFVGMHILQLGGRVQLPLRNDGSVEQHSLNKEYESFMKHHLQREVNKVKAVHRRKSSVKMSADQKNKAVADFNRVNESLKEALTYDPYSEETPEAKEELSSIMSKFPIYERDPEHFTITPDYRNTSFEDSIDTLKSIHPKLVDHFIKCYEAAANPLGRNFKSEYRTFKKGDKIALVRVIYSRKGVSK